MRAAPRMPIQAVQHGPRHGWQDRLPDGGILAFTASAKHYFFHQPTDDIYNFVHVFFYKIPDGNSRSRC